MALRLSRHCFRLAASGRHTTVPSCRSISSVTPQAHDRVSDVLSTPSNERQRPQQIKQSISTDQAFRSAESANNKLVSHSNTHTTKQHQSQADQHITTATSTRRHEISIPIDGEVCSVSSIYLRDSCQCPLCVDPSSKQRNFLTGDIPADIAGEYIGTEGNRVRIKWYNDVDGFGPDHISSIPLTLLNDLVHSTSTPDLQRLWLNEEFVSQTSDISYDDYMTSESAVLQVVRQLKSFGLVFLTDVPESEESVIRIAERIGPVKNTLYGFSWDVRSVPNATNVAYTAKDLGFHMDLLPMALPPALQVLHCMRSSAKGGHSLFVDGYRAAGDLWKADPDAYLVLCDQDVNFHYDHPETHLYSKYRPVLKAEFNSLRPEDRRTQQGMKPPHLHAMAWSPPFQGPFPIDSSEHAQSQKSAVLSSKISQWREAAAKLDEMIHLQQGVHERLMKPGQCVLFENTRVLHARTAFDVDDAGKERWLRGAYLDQDAWDSKLAVLQRKHDNGQLQ